MVASVADDLSAKTSGDDTSNAGISTSGVDSDNSDGSARSSDSDLRIRKHTNQEKIITCPAWNFEATPALLEKVFS